MSFVTVTRGGARAFIQAVMAQDSAAIAAQDAEIARRVRLEVARLRDKAEAEGRAQGEAAARAAMAPELASLASARNVLVESCAQLTAPLAAHEAELAGLVTELAVLLTRHIIGATPGADPSALTSLVANLLAEAQAARGPRQSVYLHINPADHATLAAHLAAEPITLCEDASIAAGGARLELLDPQGDPLEKIEWDATLEGRFTTIRDMIFPPGTAAANPAGRSP